MPRQIGDQTAWTGRLGMGARDASRVRIASYTRGSIRRGDDLLLYFRVHYDGGTGTEFMPTFVHTCSWPGLFTNPILWSPESGDGMKNDDYVRGAGAAITYNSNTTRRNRDLGGPISWLFRGVLGLN